MPLKSSFLELARTVGVLPRGDDRGDAANRGEAITRTLLDLVHDVICVRDLDGNVLFANAAAQDVLGVSASELAGSSIDMYLHPDDRLLALSAWQHLLSGEAPPARELRWLHPSGTVLSVEMQHTKLDTESDGRIRHRVITVIRDVSHQRSLNIALQHTRDELAGAVAAGPGVLYRLVRSDDGRWQLAFISSNIEHMTGFSVAEAMQIAWPHDTMTSADVYRRWRAIEDTLGAGHASVEYNIRAHDNTWLCVIDRLRRRDRTDGAIEIIGYLQEVTAERATERKLLMARQELDAMTRAGPGLLYSARTTARGHREIISIADNVERITGFSAAEVMNPTWFAEHSEASAHQSLIEALRPLGPDDTMTLEFRLKDRAGTWRWVRDSIRVVSRNGGSAELVGYWTDITSEKELASQLEQAHKLALLGELATGMTHELRQPLSTINFASENAIVALQQSPSDVIGAISKLEMVVRQVRRSTRLIDHMQIFGRRNDAAMGRVDLASAVDGASTIMAGRLEKANIELWCDIPEDLPPVIGQTIPIEQVLINLFSNATDAYTQGVDAPSDDIRTIKLAAFHRGEFVVVTVADTAGGIPQAIIDRVFEPFFTTKPSSKGTGLGLSISFSIVRDLGGTLSVRNEDGGAVFELRLKASQETASDGAADGSGEMTEYESADDSN